jgi:hypothetical protein
MMVMRCMQRAAAAGAASGRPIEVQQAALRPGRGSRLGRSPGTGQAPRPMAAPSQIRLGRESDFDLQSQAASTGDSELAELRCATS